MDKAGLALACGALVKWVGPLIAAVSSRLLTNRISGILSQSLSPQGLIIVDKWWKPKKWRINYEVLTYLPT